MIFKGGDRTWASSAIHNPSVVVLALMISAMLAASAARAASAPIYEPAGGSPSAPPSPSTETTATATRLAFGFGAEKLVYPECSRAAGARRCHRTVIRSFSERPVNRTVPCCHRVLVGGRLTDRTGRPLSAQRVDVIETYARGARSPTGTTQAITDSRGYFRAWLKPGPSRQVHADFRGTGTLRAASGRPLRLRVRAGVRMRVSTGRVRVGGAPVVFSGVVEHPEARIPTTGLMVVMEFRLPGQRWEQFRVLQTKSGRFNFPYTFEDDDSAGVRFLFRAFIPATGNWSFAPATSEPRAVTG